MGKKKGALDVSINSIVVIVFAITMLGLGLAFIKGYFEKAQGLVELDDIRQVPDATLKNPIATSSDTFTLEKGKNNKFHVKFYNNHELSSGGKVTFSLGDCVITGTGDVTGTEYFILTSPKILVEVGSTQEFIIQISPKTGTISEEAYICNFDATDSGMAASTNVLEEKNMIFKIK